LSEGGGNPKKRGEKKIVTITKDPTKKLTRKLTRAGRAPKRRERTRRPGECGWLYKGWGLGGASSHGWWTE